MKASQQITGILVFFGFFFFRGNTFKSYISGSGVYTHILNGENKLDFFAD